MTEAEATGLVFAPFVKHLKQMVGAWVEVATWNGTVHGRLQEVFSDHILIENGARYHVRLAAVAYVQQKADPR